MKYDESTRNRYGMIGHWSHTYRTLNFVDLYQTLLKDKHVETHSTENTFIETNIEANNVLIEGNPCSC